MKKILNILAFSILISGCSSVPSNKSFVKDVSWYCGDKIAVKKTGFKKFKDPDKKDGECVEMDSDREAYWDFYIREYEEEEMPPMPDLP